MHSSATEWKVMPLGDFASLQRGFDLPSRTRRPGSVPVVSSSGVSGVHDLAMVKAPGVVTGRYGTIGQVFYETKDFWPLNTTLWVSNFHGNDTRFVYYVLQSINFATHSGKSGVPGVNRNDLHQERVFIPADLREQGQIATALTDLDELMNSLERVIAKKQAIKQGMMQQLLTGKTRLPGFDAPWTSTVIGSVGSLLKGRGVKRDDVRPSGVPCIRYGELYTTFHDYTSVTVSFVSSDVAATALPIVEGDLLFAGSGETKAEIGTCVAYVGHSAAVAGGDIIVLRAPKVNAIFLASLLNTPEVAAMKASSGQGDAVVHINARAIGALRVDLPEKSEQAAISRVIVDADQQLEALVARLVAMRNIKKGMMQELLTGRTRLVPAEVAA